MEKIKKMMSRRDKKLRYDFLPPMLEIIERPANPAGVFLIIMVAVILASTIIWAACARLDVVVSSSGHVMTSTDMSSVICEYGGNIENIYVTDGQYVNKGDIILSIEDRELSKEIADLEYDLRLLTIQKEVYEKIHDGADIENIDTSIYSDNASIAEAIILEERLYQSNLKEYEKLKNKGEVIQESIDSYETERELTVLQNINSLGIKIHDTEEKIAEIKDKLDKQNIVAPVSGKISQFSNWSEGSIIPAGAQVAYIIPEGTTVNFSAYVLDRDIKDIKLGDTVKVRLAVYDDTASEIVDGNVTKISDIAASVQGLGTVYMVEVSLPADDNLKNYIGSEGRCDIIIGTRSVLDYFLEPFEKGLNDSLKES